MATTQATHETVPVEQLEKRDIRALTEPMTTMTNVDGIEPPEYEVTSSSGSCYVVDIDAETCTCPDHEYRNARCKHIRRCEFATGRRAIPGYAAQSDSIDDQLGAHIDETPRVAMTDGGVVALGDDGTDDRDLEAERVDGGVLVWEPTEFGRELAGFAEVTDWDAIRSEVARRGLGVGAIYHLEEFDPEEVSA